MQALQVPHLLMPLLRKLLLPLACVCLVALTSCGLASFQPDPSSAPASQALSQPARERNQEAMPELGVFADGNLNNSPDLGHSEDLGELSLLNE